jgi:hypothetical protein
LLLVLGCGLAHGEEPGDIFAKEPYAGTVDAQILVPNDAREAEKESGTGVARFVPLSDGRARLEVQANIRRENDSGFVIEGVGDATGWNGRSNTLAITIDPHGRITGGGIENQHRITFRGLATPMHMDLTVVTEKLAKAAGDTLPAGTRIVFDYHLERDAQDAAGTAAAQSAGTAPATGTAPADENPEKTCRRRVWKMRNVATPGGGMVMTQVPHCLD